MCLQRYVAATEPIDPPYDPAVGGLGGIVRLPEAKAGEFRAFTKPYVYGIWMLNGCACGCARPGSPHRRALVALLEWALRSVPEVQLYTCQQDDEGSEPNLWDWCMPTELLYLREFNGREFLVMPRDTDPSAPDGGTAHGPSVYNATRRPRI